MLAATRGDEVSSGTHIPAGSSKRQRLSEGRWRRDANKEPPQTHSTYKPLCISKKKDTNRKHVTPKIRDREPHETE